VWQTGCIRRTQTPASHLAIATCSRECQLPAFSSDHCTHCAVLQVWCPCGLPVRHENASSRHGGHLQEGGALRAVEGQHAIHCKGACFPPLATKLCLVCVCLCPTALRVVERQHAVHRKGACPPPLATELCTACVCMCACVCVCMCVFDCTCLGRVYEGVRALKPAKHVLGVSVLSSAAAGECARSVL